MPHVIDSNKVIANWSVPVMGILHHRPILSIPENALYDGMNVLVRDGLLRTRPGKTLFTSTQMTGRPTGAFSFISLADGAFEPTAFENTAFQVDDNTPGTNLVIGTTRKIYAYFGGFLNDITGTTLTALDGHLSRFASIFITADNTIQVVHVNGVDAPLQWNGSDATFTTVAGTPPATAFDIACIADHMVIATGPYTLRWCDNQDLTSWPAANLLTVADTSGPIVAIRSMGTLGGVIFKTDSIWALLAIGGAEESFFRKEFRFAVEGPAGVGAVVDANGLKVWMTRDGRIGAYDGAGVQWIAEGIKPLIQASIDIQFAPRIMGAFEPKRNEVWFYYPKTGDNGDLKGIAIVRLPDPDNDSPTFSAFMGETTLAFSGASDLRESSKQILSLTTDGFALTVDSNSGGDDHGEEIEGFWQQGLVATRGLEIHQLDSYEVYGLRGPGYGSLQAAPVSTYLFDTEGGTVGTAKTIDLTQSKTEDAKSNPDVSGRAFGLYTSFSTPVTLGWLGARLATSLRKG